MGMIAFLAVLLMVANMWLYMEIRALRRRADEIEEDLEITWTWCDTHAKEHIKLNDRMDEQAQAADEQKKRNDLGWLNTTAELDEIRGRLGRIEEGLDLDPDALGRAEREERLFFDGMNNILNYTYEDARKAAAADE